MTDPVESVFTALADSRRRDLLVTVAAEGPLTATALAADIPISRQAVAKHLAVLGDAGLVSAERSGRETLYTATPEPLGDATEWMARVGADWDRRLAALQRHLRSR